MISFEQARTLILSNKQSFGVHEVELEEAFESVLAEDVFASRDFPPFNRSAMDGIAVRFADLENGLRTFKCVETIFAGDLSIKKLTAGECYKIMTGAPVPVSANAVIRFEDVLEEGGNFRLLTDVYALYQNIAQQGHDLKQGHLAVKAGTLINAATLGLLASMGKSRVKVKQLPTVNIITTGNEVVDLNHQVSPTQIYNSNKYVLKALLRQMHIKPKNCLHIKDEAQSLKNAIKSNLSADILILSGGVSAGEADFIPEILTGLGVEKLFYKVAIKPGKPVWCGKLGKKMVFALPGNPFSCLVTFKLFVAFYIEACLGSKTADAENLPVAFGRIKKTNLDEFFPVELKDGNLNKIDINGSGDVRLGFAANALAMQKADQKELSKGDVVSCFKL